LLVVKGYAALETGHAYALSRELWEQLGSPSEFLKIPYGQSLYHVYRGEIHRAQRLDEDLLRLSRQRNDSAGLVLGHYSSGRTLMFTGRFASSRSHLEAALALYDPFARRPLVHQAGNHPHVTSQAFLGIVLFSLGYSDKALAQSSAAIAEARRQAHPPSLASSLAAGARLLSLVGDKAALDVRADQLVAVTTEQGSPMACAGNHLSRVGQGQKWRRDGGDIAPAQRFERLPRDRGGVVDALLYRPPGQSMRDCGAN
jgi:predicted ATPase